MPAASQNQQEAMGMADAIQQGKMQPTPGTPSAKIAKTMKPADVKEFTSTPQKGLPVKRNPVRTKVVGKPVKKVKF